MNEQANIVVERVIRALDEAAIAHMLVGSYSTNAWGAERSTKDADFVIELGEKSISVIADRLGPDIVIDRQISFESVTLTSRYEATHTPTNFGIEFFLLADEPFHQERFRRRLAMPFGSVTAFLATPEDAIIQKLRWFVRARRPKDVQDVRIVMGTQSGNLDLPYIYKWCDVHGTREVFDTLYESVQKFTS